MGYKAYLRKQLARDIAQFEGEIEVIPPLDDKAAKRRNEAMKRFKFAKKKVQRRKDIPYKRRS